MASNPNIILQGQPVDTGNILNSFLVGRKLGQENLAIEKQNKLAEVLVSTPREKLTDTLYQQGMFKEAQDYSKNQADIAKTEAETKAKDFEYRSKMLDASLNLTNAFANDPMLNKEKMLSELSLLRNSGVIDDTIYQQSSSHIAELPDDTLSLRNWAQQTQRRLMGAKESMQYQMPDANAQLQAQASMTNAQLGAETQRRNQDMVAETQRGNQELNYDLGMQRLENDRQKAALTGLKQSQPKSIDITKMETGKQQLSSLLGQVGSEIGALKELGATSSPDAGSLHNAMAYLGNTAIGQMAGQAIGSKEQTIRDNIKNLKPRILSAIMSATGMSSKQMDSNAELKLALDSLGSSTQSAESQLKIIKNLEDTYINNGQNMGNGTTESWGAPIPPAPKGIDPARWQQYFDEGGR